MATTLLYFLFVLGVLVFVHELGHFLAARRVGIRVLTFSLGFGPKLLKFQKGDTEYCISALPLGGYVKMAGESGEEPRTGAPDEFMSKTKWQRFQVLIMGPLMNLLLAVALGAIVLFYDNQQPVYANRAAVVGQAPADSPGAKAGLREGDTIVGVDGSKVTTWRDLVVFVGVKSPGTTLDIEYEREGQRFTTTVVTDKADDIEGSTIGVKPDVYPLITGVEEQRPAARGGVKPGDLVLAANGQRVFYSSDLSAIIEANAGKPVELSVRRDGTEQTLQVVPEADPTGKGKIGVRLSYPTELVSLNAFEAVGESVKRSYLTTSLIFGTIKGFFTGDNSVRQLQGPIQIAKMSGDAAREGPLYLLEFMAMLSLNLGLLNLLPIPILDGGHILIMALEGVARRDFSMQMKERMLMAGFVVLMMLMVTVFYNDLSGLGVFRSLLNWNN